MRPSLVVAGGLVAALGASALLDAHGAPDDGAYRGTTLAYVYAGGLTAVGLALAAAGLLLD